MRHVFQDGDVIVLVMQRPDDIRLPMLNDYGIRMTVADVNEGNGFFYLASVQDDFYDELNLRGVPVLLDNYADSTCIAKWDGENMTVYPTKMNGTALALFFGISLGENDMATAALGKG